jgi:hypothetical protein
MRPIAIAVSSVLCLAPSAMATEDPSDVVDGVYVGHRIGSEDKVTVELRGGSLVVLDPNAVSVGRVDGWALAGPGTKTGGLRFKAEVKPLSHTTRSGKTKPARAGGVSFMRLHLEAQSSEAALCLTAPGSKAPPPTGVPVRGARTSEPGATCFELTRVWRPAHQMEPTTRPPGPDCVAECVTRNQMRAVGHELIESDCRAECAR